MEEKVLAGDFTQGNIANKLIRFMIPILGALVLQAMYGAVSYTHLSTFEDVSRLVQISWEFEEVKELKERYLQILEAVQDGICAVSYTHLYNKNRLIELLNNRERDGQDIAVIYWDVNQLKYVNDNWGCLLYTSRCV